MGCYVDVRVTINVIVQIIILAVTSESHIMTNHDILVGLWAAFVFNLYNSITQKLLNLVYTLEVSQTLKCD